MPTTFILDWLRIGSWLADISWPRVIGSVVGSLIPSAVGAYLGYRLAIRREKAKEHDKMLLEAIEVTERIRVPLPALLKNLPGLAANPELAIGHFAQPYMDRLKHLDEYRTTVRMLGLQLPLYVPEVTDQAVDLFQKWSVLVNALLEEDNLPGRVSNWKGVHPSLFQHFDPFYIVLDKLHFQLVALAEKPIHAQKASREKGL